MKYEFDDFLLDTSAHELRHRGNTVPIEPKVFGVLRRLIENRDRVVSKDELIEVVWDGRFVSDSAVSSAMNALRRALNDEGQGRGLIRTIRGRGFRFVAEIAPGAGPDSKTAGQPDEGTLIAVHQFTSPDASDDGGLCGLVTDAIATELSRFRSATVKRSETWTGTTPNDEGFSVTGTVWRHGDTLRIATNLMAAPSGHIVWSERYDATLADPFAWLDRLGGKIAATIVGRIDAATQAGVVSLARDALSDADKIRLAQAYYTRVSHLAFSDGLVLLQEVLNSSPRDVRALMLAGAIHDMAYFAGWTDDPQATLDTALECGFAAVESDPSNATAHAHFGESLLHARRIDEARGNFQQAMRLNPNDVTVRTLYAAFLTESGQPREALDVLNDTRELDPFELNWIPWIRAEAHFAMGDYSAALASLGDVHMTFNAMRPLQVACLVLTGREGEGVEVLERFKQVARREMAWIPGNAQEWQAFFGRESSNHDTANLDTFFDALSRAGLLASPTESG